MGELGHGILMITALIPS